MIRVFIGFDPREAIVYHVCVNSIIRHSTLPVSITPLALTNIKGYRETHGDGSNQFSYTRFMVPELMNYKGWALYIDGDMLLRTDLSDLWSLRDDSKAVMCVQHEYKTKAARKYTGAVNQDYPRKNWSSVVLWNCDHPSNRDVDSQFIANASGAQLHRFSWLSDELIGAIPKVWNWLPDEFGSNADAKLLHWTLGAPCFHEFATAPMASEWHRERLLASHVVQLE
ncbi:glycosyltransferase [Burkholderiales bacterium]|jgi:hypothetical protein|nr:glycosyltransferase [Burkholderiales bacterium]